MTHLTWKISIPGYSYPSAAQKKLFNKLYPGAAAAYHEEAKWAQQKADAERDAVIAAEVARYRACSHDWVSTGTDGVVCRSCKVFRYYPNTDNKRYECG